MARISIKQLFLLTLITACVVAWFATPTAEQRIRKILSSPLSDTEKLSQLEEFFELGDSERDIDKRIGRSHTAVGGSVQHDSFYDCGLVLTYRSNGTLFRIGYNERPNGSSTLVYHELCAWPLFPEDSESK